MKNLNKELQKRKAQHLYRSRRISDGPQQPEMLIDGNKVTSFCSNDYLGLANHPEIKAAFIKGIERYGAGSGAAHLINGHTRAHHELELELAEFSGYPRALLFSTGYMANLGLTQAMAGKGDTVLEDRLNHASLLDGGLLSGARLMRYRHNDAGELDTKLATRKQGEKLVLSDGVFSMDGDIADVAALADTCKKHDAWLMIDDAHGFGVLGDNGRGTLEHGRVSTAAVPVYMATLGKALGTAGAFIAGSDELVETLIQKARTYIYTTATPAAIAEATRASLKIIRSQPQLRERLQQNIRYFRNCCAQTDIKLSDSSTAIQPIIIGDTPDTVSTSNELFTRGVLVSAIRPPTVPEGTARLRITLSAAHSHEQIDKLVSALNRIKQ
ncbi:MAG: 8-amino-7-oxononanoate synthase [Gammaproteobacteria bacterium]|nr:8-amino-7-oxononanoate synthase [Gammaproteobacteria bacterium]